MGIRDFANMIYRMVHRCKVVFSVTYIWRYFACFMRFRVLCEFCAFLYLRMFNKSEKVKNE